jgi:putative transposase
VSAYVDQHRARFGVEPICETLDVSASAYYQRNTSERSARRVEDQRLLAIIRQTHAENYEAYGYRRMWKALGRAGEPVARCQVQRLMAEQGIQGAKRRGRPWRTTRADPEALRSPDRVGRDFTASRPNALWVTDFTYLRCWEGVVYFSFVIDVFSRMIVGWQLAANMRTTLVLDALRMALGLREHGADVALVHHSDAGSQPEFNRSTQQLLFSSSERCFYQVSQMVSYRRAETTPKGVVLARIAQGRRRSPASAACSVVRPGPWDSRRRVGARRERSCPSSEGGNRDGR